MLQVNCELRYVKLFDKVSMSVVAIFWITWFSEEFLSDVKKIRPNKMGEEWMCWHTCICNVWTKRSRTESKYLLWEVKIHIHKGEARNLNF